MTAAVETRELRRVYQGRDNRPDVVALDSLTLAASLGWDSIARRTVALYADLAGQTAVAGRDEQTFERAAGAPKS